MTVPLETPDFNDVASWLRTCSADERVQFLKRHFNHRASYRLAISTINNRKEALELVRFGLDAITKPHSQQTKGIVQFGIVKIGLSRTISEISNRIDNQPHVVDMAVYWIPRLVPETELKLSRFTDLQHEAQEKGIIRPPRRIEHPDETVTCADRYAD
ncbi:MAG: hypothetical protein GY904_06915 [Planctomycetaceae bacterium]|nr:hypothetical protein [Planctomycetaceae bacterium]